MKLEKAIEILTKWKEPESVDAEEELAKAVKLGIEALKRLQMLRGYSMTQVDTRLPGETKE